MEVKFKSLLTTTELIGEYSTLIPSVLPTTKTAELGEKCYPSLS